MDRELRRLPLPRAPQTLLPRVMAAVQAWAQRPWYTRAWFAWPPRPGAWSSLAPVVLLACLVLEPAACTAEVAAATDASARPVGFAVLRRSFRTLLAVVVLMGLTCAAFGLALNYVLLERAEQR